MAYTQESSTNKAKYTPHTGELIEFDQNGEPISTDYIPTELCLPEEQDPPRRGIADSMTRHAREHQNR